VVGESSAKVGDSSTVVKSSLGVEVNVSVGLKVYRLCPIRGEELRGKASRKGEKQRRSAQLDKLMPSASILPRTLYKPVLHRAITHQEVNVLLICMPLELHRELIEVINPDLRLVRPRRHGMVSIGRRPYLEGGLGKLKVLDELDVAKRSLGLGSFRALLVLGSLGQPRWDRRLTGGSVDGLLASASNK
jgi:hypothetical protein